MGQKISNNGSEEFLMADYPVKNGGVRGCPTCIASGGYPGVCPDCGWKNGVIPPAAVNAGTSEVKLDSQAEFRAAHPEVPEKTVEFGFKSQSFVNEKLASGEWQERNGFYYSCG